MFDGKAFGEEIVGFVREYLEREVAPLKAENAELKERLQALEDRPAPEVIKGDPGEPGKDGADGKDGSDGADGRGVKELLIDREGHLIATMDDGSTKDLGPVNGKDGAPGKDGRDGFSLDDFDCQPVDERTIRMEFVRGETKHSYELQFPVTVYRGVFKEGSEYERGDMVTWGGNLWHCDTPTKDKPGTENWTIAAKKGRDGKDAKPNG